MYLLTILIKIFAFNKTKKYMTQCSSYFQGCRFQLLNYIFNMVWVLFLILSFSERVFQTLLKGLYCITALILIVFDL